MLLLHSQRRYIFEFDQSDCLLSVTMPSMVRHSLQTMLSVGYYRNIYTPPDSSTSFIQDYSRDGRLLQTLHLGTGRRVLYKYTKQARLSEILYDTTQVTLTYEESSGVIKTIHLMHDGFICTIRYRQTGLLWKGGNGDNCISQSFLMTFLLATVWNRSTDQSHKCSLWLLNYLPLKIENLLQTEWKPSP